ncbi:MAG: hypothetical protein ACLPWS_15220, partial [Rhodomicrobium sp.]
LKDCRRASSTLVHATPKLGDQQPGLERLGEKRSLGEYGWQAVLRITGQRYERRAAVFQFARDRLGGPQAEPDVQHGSLAARPFRQFESFGYRPRRTYGNETCFRKNLREIERQKQIVLNDKNARPLAE